MAESEVAENSNIKFFGEVDLNSKGKVVSTYPSWYFSHLKDNLKEEIRMDQYKIDNDLIPRSEVAIHKQRLVDKEAKLRSLEQAIPKISGKDKDRIAKVRAELGEKISEAMFSYDQMQRGLANPHEEMRRMTEPCVKLQGEVAEMARAMNIRVGKGGVVSRTQAEKVWKIASRVLGENSNTESLRR